MMKHDSVHSLLRTMRLAYTSQLDDIEDEYNWDAANDLKIEAQAIMKGAIDILSDNPDVDVSCHFETGTPATA